MSHSPPHTLPVAFTFAAIAFAVVYAAEPPAPGYNPLDGSWAMRHPEAAPSMGWYGRTAWGLGAAIAAGAVGGFWPEAAAAEGGSAAVAPQSRSRGYCSEPSPTAGSG